MDFIDSRMTDYLIHNCEKKMGGSEQPVRSIQRTRSKLGRSHSMWAVTMEQSDLRRWHASIQSNFIYSRFRCQVRCHSSSTLVTLGRLSLVLVHFSSTQEPIFLRLCFVSGWIQSHHWMKLCCLSISTCVWFWKNLEGHKLNFPRGRDFLLPQDYWSLKPIICTSCNTTS